MLQEENEGVLEKVNLQTTLICTMQCDEAIGFMCGFNKLFLNLNWQLRLAEERCEEAEARAKELEKQVR